MDIWSRPTSLETIAAFTEKAASQDSRARSGLLVVVDVPFNSFLVSDVLIEGNLRTHQSFIQQS